MAASAHPQLVDPLAVEEPSAGRGPQSPRTGAGTGGCVVPELIGSEGAGAVQAIRAAGLIAVIEPVTGEPAGVVLGQDPQAGVELAFEGLVTVKVAAPSAVEADESAGAAEPAATLPGEEVPVGDDTQEWFDALAGDRESPVEQKEPGEGTPPLEQEAPAQGVRRRRKPRPVAHEDAAGAPSLVGGVAQSGALPFLLLAARRGPAVLRSRRVQRATAFGVCLLAGLLFGVRVAGHGSTRPVVLARVPAGRPRAASGTRHPAAPVWHRVSRGGAVELHTRRAVDRGRGSSASSAPAPVPPAAVAPAPSVAAAEAGPVTEQAVLEFQNLAQ
jgi:hypothetical protein